MSAIYPILTLRLLVKNFGLNMFRYDTWNAELPLCECGDYDTNEYLIFHCQRINRRA